MAYAGGAAAGAAGAAAAAIANAIKASGSLVKVRPDDFLKILHRNKDGIVVSATGGFFSKNYQYLTSYKGLFFFTKNDKPINIPGTVEHVTSEKIWIPG
ncbi:hypothetical protein GF420_03585 [candidate division GN15 bacterium]|jgi:hypothetical protein|nr:hypothetical protein [candidate division GN15 bacterium]